MGGRSDNVSGLGADVMIKGMEIMVSLASVTLREGKEARDSWW